MKFVLTALFFLIGIFIPTYTKAEDSTKTFMDKVQDVVEIRRSFETKSETTKPALLSYTKDSDERAVYKIDIAVLYKGFYFKDMGIAPAVQFEYTSSGKSREEKFKGSLLGYWDVGGSKAAYFKVEPTISFARDFITNINSYEGRLMLLPRFPNFVIPIRNITDIKLKYDREDKWVAGFNPAIGFVYEDKLGRRTSQDVQKAYSITQANFSLKKHFMLFDIYGKYEKEFDEDARSGYKYGANMTLYFDVKERSSFNFKVEKENKDTGKTKGDVTKFTLGFGIKL